MPHARQQRSIPLALSAALLVGLLLGAPVSAVRAIGSPVWRVVAIADGEAADSYVVPTGNPGGITLSDVASDYGYEVPLLLVANAGADWGDCNADGSRDDAGEFHWPTLVEARDGDADTTDITFCGAEEIRLPRLVEGAAISIVAGAGIAGGNPWNGTSLISATTGASGTFSWDGKDYFGNDADPDSDGTGLEAAEMAGAKVVVSASGYGVAAVGLELAPFASGDTRYTIVSLKSNGRPMEVVNAFGGQTTSVVADGAPCTFYTTTSTSPSLWRSFDCGGSWSPVVLSSDERAEATGNDGVEGMDKNSIVTGITASGWPGEVAVIVSGRLWFSRDFGTSWNSFDLKSYTAGNGTGTTISGSPKPYWAHAYDETANIHSSYLFLVGGLIGGSSGPLSALSVYATVMPTGDEYSIVDDNITATDSPCDGFAADCPATEIKPGQFFELTTAIKSRIAGGDGATTRGTWTGWLFDAKPGRASVYVATQQGATGGVVIAKLPQPTAGHLFTPSDLKSALAVADNFTLYNGSNGATAELYEVRSPFQDVDVDGCANGCAMSRDLTATGGQVAQDLMVFGGPSGVIAEDVNHDGTDDNAAATSTDYEGPRSIVIWDRTASGPNSTATVRIATWVTNNRAISSVGTYDDADHWETAATGLDADAGTGDTDHAVRNDLYSRGGNSAVESGCLEGRDTIGSLQPGRIGQVGGGGDAECAPNPNRRTAATCGENTTGPVGSVAPMLGVQDSGGFGQTIGEYFGTVAMIRSCIVVHGINVKGTSDIGNDTGERHGTGAGYGVVAVMDTPGANNNTGSAFDSGFNFETGSSGSSVVLSGDGARGLVKAATWTAANPGDRNVKFTGAATANYVPLFPQASHSAWNFIANRADAGTAASSGGFAVNGLAAPVVRDTAFNPADPDGVVATFSFTGGGRSVISYDGGQHYFTFAGGGSNAISWWKGPNEGTGAGEQGTNWILTGSLTGGGFSVAHFTDEEWLAAKDAARTTDFDQPVEELGGSTLVAGAIREERANPGDPGAKTAGCADAINVGIRGDMFDGAYFGLSGQADTVSITGIQGTDVALVVLGSGPSSPASASDAYTVLLVKLKADGNAGIAGEQPCINDIYYLSGSTFVQHPGTALGGTSGTGPGRVGAVAYCPTDGAGGTGGNSLGVGIADAVEDLALIAIADESSTGGYDDGKIIRIAGIFGNSITVSSPTTSTSGYRGGDYRDLKMDCDTGLVFAVKKGAGSGTTASTAAAIYSLDGAQNFAPMGFGSSLALKNAISSIETIAVEADPGTGAVDVVVVASGGNVVSAELDLRSLMPASTTLADLDDEAAESASALKPVAVDPSATGEVGIVNDPAAADGFYFGGEKPGDIDYPASADEAPAMIVDGVDESAFGAAGVGVAAVGDAAPATPIFGAGGGALDVTARMAVFSFGSSTINYTRGHAATTITGWQLLPASAEDSGAAQSYAVASASSAYCEIKSSGGRAYLHIKKPGTCKVAVTAAAAAPYLAGTNVATYVLAKGSLGAPAPGDVAGVPPAAPAIGTSTLTLFTYFDDASADGYQAATGSPKITWSEATGGTAAAAACVVASGKLTLKPVAGDAAKTCKVKATVAASANWPAYTSTYTVTFASP